MLVNVFPVIAPLNIMGLQSPLSAILSAVIFNALIIMRSYHWLCVEYVFVP